ncbi:MAG: type II toxin-antitoxin system prevent-host-death family antitoxin [Chloroflexi bacterium]|nr:type II toxin-antitoxin system prevent-host-death family antitoxin [Chloroflexota bacterium]
MVRSVSVAQARAQLADLLGSVHYTQEPVVVEKKGKPFAVVISPEQYDRLRGEDERARQMVERARERHAAEQEEDVLAHVTVEVAAIRQDRSEHAPAAPLEAIRQAVLPILQHYGATRAGLFGSVVRGELLPSSDIDILVELGPDLSLLDIARINRELEEALGRRVDLVEYPAIKPRIKEHILSEEVRIL